MIAAIFTISALSLWVSELGAADHRATGLSASQTLAVAALFEEEILADNVSAVYSRLSTAGDSDRLEFLAKWILPSESRRTFRMRGIWNSTDTTADCLTSPIFELLDIAAKIGQLEELRTRVAATPDSTSGDDRRAKAAIMVLLNLELNDSKGTDLALTELQSLTSASLETALQNPWPELLVAWRAAHRTPVAAAVVDLVEVLTERQNSHLPVSEELASQTQLFYLLGLAADATGRSAETAGGLDVGLSDSCCLERIRIGESDLVAE